MCLLLFTFGQKNIVCDDNSDSKKPYNEHKEGRELREGLGKSSHLPHNELLFSIHLLGHQPQIFSTSPVSYTHLTLPTKA